MNILAVDTSGPVCGVAIARDGRVLYEGAAVNKMTHSVNLMPMVREALTRAGLEIDDIDLLAAVVGPGSFTGVRIGVSTVKGLAHGLGKPCVGVDALEALAAGAGETRALLCPLQDARAGQVYAAMFDAEFPPLRQTDNEAAKLEVFLEHALAVAGDERPLCFVGDGAQVFREAIMAQLGARALFPAAHLATLRPAAVALLADAHRNEQVDYLGLMPVYLRAPQAERARAAKLAAQKT
ncbi:MAG: tRNA (adenosine(37)-N6)-threonylcarbamoyltransferase complex dimerization subunit type 1 TsaB [Eubacteriales bacterium]|nr:tRNA (adenosine(37)-N6)-threonylcarbamoyltransferase complex dimerization subunit type 1 TsaB [Eubacteriales bacterium]